MSWYSFILLSVPEAFILALFLFILFRINVRDNTQHLILFAVIYGGFTFLLSVYFDTSYKPFLTFTMFILLMLLLFRFKPVQSLLLGLSAFVTLGLMELFLTLILIHVFPINLNYAEILSDPWTRILFSYITALIPLLLLTMLLHKLRLKIDLFALISK
ncbi:hypothetical protein ACERII_10145 [Evansella sp. AB-rgal1]|uniref:hypothetical protein n=1 Tax=Evansella sp. AB-rgal1 TaxID=3242696 RepID=UPI00359D3B4D